jgi:hypothetical protein
MWFTNRNLKYHKNSDILPDHKTFINTYFDKNKEKISLTK